MAFSVSLYLLTKKHKRQIRQNELYKDANDMKSTPFAYNKTLN